MEDSKIKPIYEAPINSLILVPNRDDQIEFHDDDEGLMVTGVAIPSSGSGIAKIEVYAGGKWFKVQEIEQVNQPPGRQWAWTKWSVLIPKSALKADDDGKITLSCRATGDNYATQDNSEQNWNM